MQLKRANRLTFGILAVLALALSFGGARADDPAAPVPDPSHANLFYGAVPTPANLPPDIAASAPVIVFVHGLGGTAMNWWNGNDMYATAFARGYRTAFISMSPDNTPNAASVADNAMVVSAMLPLIATHYEVDKLYLVGHSKGGVDIQAAMLDPAIAALVRAVFTISTPNQGTELAEWAFENPTLAGPLNLLSDAVNDLRPANMQIFRETADPVLKEYGIPFYNIAGTKFTGDLLTLVTGSILRTLVPGPFGDVLTSNDGFVTVARTRLPNEYAADLGNVATNHLDTDSGNKTFSKIQGRIQTLEFMVPEFKRVAANGFKEFGGSEHNTWLWSAKWYQGKLYVGTGREINCVTLLTSDVRLGTSLYSLSELGAQCPNIPTLVENLGAEIWQFDPATGNWKRVFQSPNDLPVAEPITGSPAMTARDCGFRGMEVHVESDGTEALYAGGVNCGSIFERLPFEPRGFPPPRLLRTTDGKNWAPLPQDPGTFLGDVGEVLINPTTKYRSFRSLVSYHGKLFATLADFVGSGVIVASENPAAGNDAWRQVSPPRPDLPVWTLTVFSDYLYLTTGATEIEDPSIPGYGVYKTNAEGSPYQYIPVVTNGGHQDQIDYRAPNGLSFGQLNGQLYVGTNRPTELIRINPDDSWDLVVGEPRQTPDGYKAPISGFGVGFESWFNGHFWRQASVGGELFLGTWDWGSLVQGIGLLKPYDDLHTNQFGFDLLRTDDGVHWTAVTRGGMGTPYNTGVRSLETTPVGLFLGTAGERKGGDVFLNLDPDDSVAVSAPRRLTAASEMSVGRVAQMAWEPIAGAVRYRVYRSNLRRIDEPLTTPVSVAEAVPPVSLAGNPESESLTLAWACALGDTSACDGARPLGAHAATATASIGTSPYTFLLPAQIVAVTTTTKFREPAPSPDLPAVYFVRAENAEGELSAPSNIVAAPSLADPKTSPFKVKLSGSASRRVTGSCETLALDLTAIGGVPRPGSRLSYIWSKTRARFAANSIDSVTTTRESVVIRGKGAYNNRPDHAFEVRVTDGKPDRFGVTVRRPDGTTLVEQSDRSATAGNIVLNRM